MATHTTTPIAQEVKAALEAQLKVDLATLSQAPRSPEPGDLLVGSDGEPSGCSSPESEDETPPPPAAPQGRRARPGRAPRSPGRPAKRNQQLQRLRLALRLSTDCSAPETTATPLVEEAALFHTIPESVLSDPAVPYIALQKQEDGLLQLDAATLLRMTPLPKGSTAFSSLHVVVAPGRTAAAGAESLKRSCTALGRKVCSMHSWPAVKAGDLVAEYEAVFSVASDLILAGADRSSLLVFLAASGGVDEMAVAAILGMLPFRGLQVAFISPKGDGYVDPLQRLQTPSGLFEYDAGAPERMGRCPFAAIFGPLECRVFQQQLRSWSPLRPAPSAVEKPAPFKIGGLVLPMVTFEGSYDAGVERLAGLLLDHYGPSLFPVVACGQTVDALGYGSDILEALAAQGCSGHYFSHASGESEKRPEAYGSPGLLRAVLAAKQAGRHVVVVAVGGGVNGNAMGTLAAMVGAELVEVPTTLMHYNDATTSAKKAFSLVVEGRILSKNILGTFYLPQLVFCISETFLSLGSCSIHAAVGEATKTMSMLGDTSSASGQRSFQNILGAAEFAGDFTRIINTVEGFEHLIGFLGETQQLKKEVLAAGQALCEARRAAAGAQELKALAARRRELLGQLRARFHEGLPSERRAQILSFFTVINEEVIRAKAMFLAYSDPFEKYRALLFEYAHTLGHGVEAFMNGLYGRAEALGLDVEPAFRLHGQCVGMAVLWAGAMSNRLGHLEGDGYLAHQSLVYLFNRFGGFDFGPLRRLCDELDVSREEFCEGVLSVVRRDNKRGYCKCSPTASVDQLVQDRPGCLLRSADPSAELRYLVEVSEDSQLLVLERAFEGDFDNVLLPSEAARHGLAITPRSEYVELHEDEEEEEDEAAQRAPRAAAALRRLLRSLCQDAEEGPCR